MLYSQCLLSKNGALGTVWLASHCLKRLKKDQVFQTNISSSVDKILSVEEGPVVLQRLFAFLLLGVVKIYSQKVEYLYDDCHQVVEKINNVVGIKKTTMKGIEGMRAPRLSISRPKKLELDAFDLQIMVVGNGDNLRAGENITLEDACTNEDTSYHSSEKNYHEADDSHPEHRSTTYTPVTGVISPYTVENEKVNTNFINSLSSIENIRINNFSLDDRLEPMVLGDDEGEQDFFGLIFEKSNTDGKQATLISEKQNEGFFPEEINLLEMELVPERGKHQLKNTGNHLAIMSVDVTFQSKGPRDSGNTSLELINVQTPIIMECDSSSRKTKCLLDEVTILSNKEIRDNLNDTSRLVCKRLKAPHTPLHAWKRHKISNLSRTFSEPLFPGVSSELRALFRETNLEGNEAVKDMENIETFEKLNMFESPTWDRSSDEAHIAPCTPVTQSASLRSHDDVETIEFDRGAITSTFKRIEEEPSQSEEEDLQMCFNNEDISSQGGLNEEGDGWSDRTRLIASQLIISFAIQKKGGENKTKGIISLSQTLENKVNSQSANFFYEILMLKTRGYIDVEQNKAYGDILVLETPKLLTLN